MRTSLRAPAAPREEAPARVSHARPSALGVVVAVLMAAAPAALTYLLVHMSLDAQVGDFVPSFWNDQVGYWHRIASFSEVAFKTGYYSPSEAAPPFDPVRYGVNGPWFPMVYGSVAAVVGWGSATSVFVNMIVVGLGLIAFVSLARLDVSGTVLTGIAVATLWPVLLYVPTASQESLQQALAMVLAGIFVRALRNGPDLSVAEKAAGISFIAAASILRFSWAVLLPCLIVLFARQITVRRVAAALGAGAVLLLFALRLTSALQPPGQNTAVDSLSRLTSDPVDAVTTFVDTTWENLKLFLYPGALDPTAPPFAVRGSLDATGVQSWEIVGLTALALIAVLASLGRPTLPAALRDVPVREALFHLVNLGVVAGAALALYIPNGYYRVLGAHLLLSVLVLVASRRVAVVATIVALNLVMLPSFLDAYGRWKPNFSLDQTVLERDRAAFSRLIEYEDGASNPWCNTLLLPVEVYDWRVTLVPAGIGVSYALSADLPQPPKSRYVLLTGDPLPFNAAVNRRSLRELGSLAAGTLYENPASLCFRRASG